MITPRLNVPSLLVSAQNPYGVLHFTRNSEDGVLGFSKKLFLSSGQVTGASNILDLET